VRRALAWAALLVAGAVVFARGLGREPLWLDETFSYALIQHGFAEILRFTAEDVHPPLYYCLLKLTTLAFGTSDAALRLPSLLAALGLVALGAGPVRRIWGDRTGVIYALLALTSPGLLCFAQEARMYTLLALSACACTLYGYLALIGRRRADFVVCGVVGVAAAYTHYYGVLVTAVTYLALGWLALRRERESRRALAWTVAGARARRRGTSHCRCPG
jgi:uncharacterized membrane protein